KRQTHERGGKEPCGLRHDVLLQPFYCGEDCESTVPSASVTRVVRPVWLPSRAGLKSTVIVSPGLKIVFDQPVRANIPGERPSICHSVLPPLPSSTDRWIHTCGFVHSHRVTVPLSTTTLSGSNAELLWCARADVAAKSTAMKTDQVFIGNPSR